MLKTYYFGRSKRLQQASAFLIIVIVAAAGTFLLISGHAATPYASINADTGSLANGAAKQACTGASDGSCVMFGGSGQGGGSTLYLSPTGQDAGSCTQTTPCLSFNYAYGKAVPGDTVQLAAGVYGGQTITWDASKANAGSNVTFQPASGATVNLTGSIIVQSSHVTFKNMRLVDPSNGNNKYDVEADTYVIGGAQPADPAAANNVGFITFQNITGRNFNVNGAHDVSIIGGSYGPASACGSGKPSLTQYGGGNNALRTALMASGHVDPYNITVDGVTVHNIMSYDLVGCHTEGVAIFSGSNVTVRNSKFYGNDVYDILAQANSGSGALGQVTLENNWFAQSTDSGGTGSGSNGVEFDDNKDISVTNNSFNDGLLFLAGPTFSNVSIIGNIVIGPVYAASSNGSMCGASGVTAQYNITTALSGLDCTSSTNTEVSSASSFYANPSNDTSMDYSLKSGSSAISLVPTSASPVTNDIAYHCRPAPGQTKIDAGATELNATGSCGVPVVP